ncbi:MAG: ABC transporter substrate-binding protein [Acetobacteraceae bacterium]
MKGGRLIVALLAATVGIATWSPAKAADATIKIGYIDPFSGPFAATGNNFLKVFTYILEKVNAEGGPLGKKYEIVTFDSKLQPAEALIALKSAADQNMPFVMHCVGSNVGSAMIDAVSKHNARNPDNRLLYLNCGALATELTNEQCDFWQFRFTANVDQRAVARIKTLPPSVKSVYVLNQDYLFGQSVEKATLKYLAEVPAGHQDCRPGTGAVRQGAGFLAVHCQDQGLRRAVLGDVQLRP